MLRVAAIAFASHKHMKLSINQSLPWDIAAFQVFFSGCRAD